jgi:hypothetical protein
MDDLAVLPFEFWDRILGFPKCVREMARLYKLSTRASPDGGLERGRHAVRCGFLHRRTISCLRPIARERDT